MSQAPLLEMRDVGRDLAGRRIVDGLTLDLHRGQVLGLLGVNGAGKTTTLRMLAGLLAPSRGTLRVAGEDPCESRSLARHLGYLPERAPLYAELRVIEYLRFCAGLRGLRGTAAARAVDDVIARCDLGDVRLRLVGNLSKGYAQRVGIAQAIVHEPDLIVLDEPVSGLDPLQAAKLRALLAELGREHAVVLSTHLLHDVEACCSHVAILHQGRLRHHAALQAPGAQAWRVTTAVPVAMGAWSDLACVRDAQDCGAGWRVRLTEGAAPAQLAQALVERGWGVSELRADGDDLEALFLRIASSDEARAA